MLAFALGACSDDDGTAEEVEVVATTSPATSPTEPEVTTGGSVAQYDPNRLGPPTQEEILAADPVTNPCQLLTHVEVAAVLGQEPAASSATGLLGDFTCRYVDAADAPVVTVRLLTDELPDREPRPTETFAELAASAGGQPVAGIAGADDAVAVDGTLHVLAGTSVLSVTVGDGGAGDALAESTALAAVAIARV